MPALSNPRHERFARELANGKTATEAYEIAGYKRNDGNASTLKADQRISKRVAELQAEHAEMARKATEMAAERLSVTVESLLTEAEEVRSRALAAGQYAAAIAAIKEKGVLAGLRVERRENKTVKDASQLSDAELAAIVAGDGGGGVAGQAPHSKLAH